MPRLDTRGRRPNSGDRCAILPLVVLKHEAVTTLPAAVHRVLVAMAGQFSGGNNGALSLTRSVAREYGIRSVETLQRGLAQLRERGLLELTYPGSYIPKVPACYAVTWRPLNRTEWTNETRAASHAYRASNWQRTTKAPRHSYRGDKAGGRIPGKPTCRDRSPVPVGPPAGPVIQPMRPKPAPSGPLAGPVSDPIGTAYRAPLDSYQREAA